MRLAASVFILLVAMLSVLTACQHDEGLQQPQFSIMTGHSADKGLLPTPDWMDQAYMALLYHRGEETTRVKNAHSYDLTNGEIHTFIPPGYPGKPGSRIRYECSVAIPANSVSNPGVDEAEITLEVQEFSTRSVIGSDGFEDVSFAVYTDNPGGLSFSSPVSITLCPASAQSSSGSVDTHYVYFLERDVVDDVEVYTCFDYQSVAINPSDWTCTFQVTYIPELNELNKPDREGGFIKDDDPEDGEVTPPDSTGT